MFVNKLNENRYKNSLNIAKFTLCKNLVLIFTNITQVSKNMKFSVRKNIQENSIREEKDLFPLDFVS